MPGLTPPHPATPPISAPDSARDARPHSLASPNGIAPEGGVHELMERFTGSLPDGIRDFIYGKIVTRFNDHFFTSRPAGAPVAEQPGSWHFSAIGDFGNGTRAQSDVAANLLRAKPELVVTVGDNIYPDGKEKYWRANFDPPKFFGRVLEAAPVLPVLGNHDVKPSTDGYFKRFPQLQGARYYSSDMRNVHVVALDSNDSLAPNSPQHKWLEQDLATSKAPWKVLLLHHPVLSPLAKATHGKTSRLPEYLGPLLAKHGVDLVLAGHEHFYERSRPLNEQGTHQITLGNGGAMLFPLPYSQPAWSAHRDVDFGHVNFEVRNDDELVGRYVRRDGSVADTFVLHNQPTAP